MDDGMLDNTIYLLNGHKVRTTLINNVHYVSLVDFCEYIQETVKNIVALAKKQQEHVSAMGEVMDVFNTLLEERYPDIRSELLELANQRMKMV